MSLSYVVCGVWCVKYTNSVSMSCVAMCGLAVTQAQSVLESAIRHKVSLYMQYSGLNFVLGCG